MTTEDDMQLLARWRNEDTEAGEALIRRYYGQAVGFARKKLGPYAGAAADVAHDSFQVLVQRRDDINTDFRAYLFRVVFLTVLGYRRRRRTEPLDDPVDPGIARSSRRGSSLLTRKEEIKLLVKALRSLSIEDQLVFYYDFVGDGPRADLAKILDIHPAKVYNRVYEAKRRLRKAIDRLADPSVRQSTLGGLDTWLASIHGKNVGL